MRVRYAALFFIVVALVWSAPAHAAVIDSQTDDSAQSTRPAYEIDPPDSFTVVGYVPTHDADIAGIRFRVNASGGGDYLCPTGDIMEYYGTSTPFSWNYYDSSFYRDVGSLFPFDPVDGTTTDSTTVAPDADGNCDYAIRDEQENPLTISVSSSDYYVFFMDVGGESDKWVSMDGEPYNQNTQNFFGYRPAFTALYQWGTTGLTAAYMQVYDSAPPFSSLPPEAPPIANGNAEHRRSYLQRCH